MKKIISLIVAAMMLLAVLPAGVLAEGARAAEVGAEVKEATAVASWDFETNPTEAGWQFIDSDGDGSNWGRSTLITAHSGEYTIASASYDGGVRTPDNWAITPLTELPEGTVTLSYAVRTYSSTYPETYRIYAGTTDDIEAMEPVTDDLYSPSNESWSVESVDLSDYAGQSVYIAIRHYNCTDQWRFFIDDVEVLAGEGGEPIDDDPYAIHEVYVDGWGTPIAGIAGIDHMFLTTPDGAPYYIIYGGWRDETDQQQMWSEEHVFIPGHIYTEGCQILAEEGYYFAEDCVFYGDGGTDNLDLQWCRVDENDNWICYMNSIEMVCEAVTDIPGDIDFDSDVDTADAIMVLRYIMGIIELSDAQLANAEVDGDGSVSIIDSLLVLRMALGLIEEFPAGN